MKDTANNTSVEQQFDNVNPPFNTQLPLFPEKMEHHNTLGQLRYEEIYYSYSDVVNTYGVPLSRRVLSPQLLLKRFDQVRDFLQYTLGLTTCQREVTLDLLRLWAYYGKVHPKAMMFNGIPGCSKSTFWRTINSLKSRGLILVARRFIIRPHAQISNRYDLHYLLIAIARYLAEHGVAFFEKWLKPYLTIPGQQFWPRLLVTDTS